MSAHNPLSALYPHFLLILLGSVAMLNSAAAASAPVLHAPESVNAGYFQLSWSLDAAGGARRFEIQESTTPDFSTANTIYLGSDRARVVSGKPDGNFYYRVRAITAQSHSAWSEQVAVQSRHHPLTRALGFFLVGALVFFLTLGVILRSGKSVRE